MTILNRNIVSYIIESILEGSGYSEFCNKLSCVIDVETFNEQQKIVLEAKTKYPEIPILEAYYHLVNELNSRTNTILEYNRREKINGCENCGGGEIR